MLADNIEQIEKYVQDIDPQWYPGLTVTLGHTVGNDTRSLFPFSNFRLATYLPDIFLHAGLTVMHCRLGFSNELDGFIKKAYLLLRSAWVSWRSIRVAEEKEVQRRSEFRMRRALENLHLDEKRALWLTAQAAQSAGYYYESAALSHFLLYSEPEKWRWFNPNVCYRVWEAGMQCPERFTVSHKKQYPPSIEHDSRCNPDDAGDTDEHEDAAKAMSSQRPHLSSDSAQFFKRLMYEYNGSMSAQWTLIMQQYNLYRRPPCRNVLRALQIVCQGRLVNVATFRAALSLCLHYGYLKSLFKLIDPRNPNYAKHRTRLTKSELLAVGRASLEASRIFPFAINVSVHECWLQILRYHMGQLDSQLLPEEALELHETFLGRVSAIMRSRAQVDPYIEKFYRRVDERSIIQTLDSGSALIRTTSNSPLINQRSTSGTSFQRGPKTAHLGVIQSELGTLASCFGSIVVVSVGPFYYPVPTLAVAGREVSSWSGGSPFHRDGMSAFAGVSVVVTR